MSKRDREKGRLSPFVPYLKETMREPAWKNMSLGARMLYLHIKARYNIQSHNNGKLYLPTRTAAEELGGSCLRQVGRWFRELQHYGFIVMINGGSLGVDGKGHAPRWRLTELGYMNDPPTRDYSRWQGDLFVEQKPRRKKQNPDGESTITLMVKAPSLVMVKAPSVRVGSDGESTIKGNSKGDGESTIKSSLTTGVARAGSEGGAHESGVTNPAVGGVRPVWTTPVLISIPLTDELRQMLVGEEDLTIPTFLRRSSNTCPHK